MKHRVLVAAAAVLAVLWPAARATAFTPLDGCFVAEAACPAYHSLRKQTNPGGVTTEVGVGYALRGANRADPTHYQIRLPHARPPERWVEVGCGRIAKACTGGDAHRASPDAPEPASLGENVLVVSWQPAFCETHRTLPECRSQTEHRFDARHFALHGLWPQPRTNLYCGVSERAIDEAERWADLPAVALTERTRTELGEAMPGARSHLDRHEWIKHGTCYSETAEEYFAESLQLLRELNTSPVRDLFARRIGGDVSLAGVRAAFERAFGRGAGARVEMRCEGNLVTELRLYLRGEITPASRLRDLLAAADPVPGGCRGGRIDAAGFDP